MLPADINFNPNLVRFEPRRKSGCRPESQDFNPNLVRFELDV